LTSDAGRKEIVMGATQLAGFQARERVPEFYTVAELAARLRVSQFTIRRWIWAGRLKAKMLGSRIRISAGEAERFLSDQDWTPEVSRQRVGRPQLAQRRRKPE